MNIITFGFTFIRIWFLSSAETPHRCNFSKVFFATRFFSLGSFNKSYGKRLLYFIIFRFSLVPQNQLTSVLRKSLKSCWPKSRRKITQKRIIETRSPRFILPPQKDRLPHQIPLPKHRGQNKKQIPLTRLIPKSFGIYCIKISKVMICFSKFFK